MVPRMKHTRLGALMVWAAMAACNRPANPNVNTRYTVERIELGPAREWKLSDGLRQDLHKMEGKKFDQRAISELASRIQKELHARSVTQQVTRGNKHGHVIVILRVLPGRLANPAGSVRRLA